MAQGDFTNRAEVAQDPQFQQRVLVAAMGQALSVMAETPGPDGQLYADRVALAGQVIKVAGAYNYQRPAPPLVNRLAWAVASSFTSPGERPLTNDADLTAEMDQVWNAVAVATRQENPQGGV